MRVAPSADDHLRHLHTIVQNRNANPNHNPNLNPDPNPIHNPNPSANLDLNLNPDAQTPHPGATCSPNKPRHEHEKSAFCDTAGLTCTLFPRSFQPRVKYRSDRRLLWTEIY